MKKFLKIFFVFLISFLTLTPFLLRYTQASSLGNTYLFLERMQVDTSTGMILLITPSTNFASDSTLTITFPHDDGEWCRTDPTVLTATGASTSPLNLGGDWDIDLALPTTGSFVATCYQGDSLAGLYDRIVVTGIDALTGGVSYGLELSSNANFKTVNEVDSHDVTIQLVDGMKIESITFGINLISPDGVLVTADVAAAETITCSVNSSEVPFGVLYKGGAYSIASHTISTQTSEGVGGYYWAVYGEGDGSTEAGLYNSTGTTDLLPSTGSSTINLLTTSSGFGLVVSSSEGNIPTDFQNTTPGIFGSINRTFSGTRLILAGEANIVGFDSTITLGARAGSSSLEGDYEETLTYVCGGYIGQGTLTPASSCGDDFIDSRDSEVYSIVGIGTQCWMAKNLNYSGHTVGTSWCYDNESSNCDTYGRLYNWVAAMDGDIGESSQGVCPEGWHLPSDSEQHTLDDYLATGTCNASREGSFDCEPAGTKSKTSAWGGDNSSGFSALPGGLRDVGGSFHYLGTRAFFWSSSPSGGTAWGRYLISSNSAVYREPLGQSVGFSVRCLRD